MVLGAMAEIAAITVVLALVSQFVQNKYINKDEMKRQQEEIKGKQKRMKELMQKGDQKSKNELDSLEKEMLESMQKMMGSSTKVMIASMVIFIPALLVLGALYANDTIQLPVPVPWLSEGFDLFNIGTWGVEIYTQTNWFGWYFLAYLVVTVIINVALGFIKNNAKKSGVVLNG